MSISRDKETKSNTQKKITADANMHRQGMQNQIYGIEMLKMSICRDKGGKLKHTELKDCRCQYPETKQAK